MRNLKTLAMLGAFWGAAYVHALESGEFEADFLPVQKSGEIEGLEIFNGKLIVKSTGNINGVQTPYTVLGTNTADFAQSGFAIAEMTNLTSIIFDENHIYATREKDTNHVYRFTIENTNHLNGVKSDIKTYGVKEVSKLLCVRDSFIYVQDRSGNNTFAINAEGENISPPAVNIPRIITDNYVYTVSNDGRIYFWEGAYLKQYYPEYDSSTTVGFYQSLEDQAITPISAVAFDTHHHFILGDDNSVYLRISPSQLQLMKKNVSGISYGPDGKSLIMTCSKFAGVNRKTILGYNTEQQGTFFVYQEPEIENTKFARKEVSANGVRYRATNKKIGYSIAD